MTADLPCPECIAGKHGNCDGTALDSREDVIGACPCARAEHGIGAEGTRPERTLRDQLAIVATAAARTHGEHAQISDGTADIVCGCGEFRAVYNPDEDAPPFHRQDAYAEHVAYATADAVLTLLGAPEPPDLGEGAREPTDEEWWAWLVHQTRTPERRAEHIRGIRTAMTQAAACFIRNHARLEEEALQGKVTRTRTQVTYTIATLDPVTGEMIHHQGDDDEHRLREAFRRNVGQVARYPATARLYRGRRTYLTTEPGPFIYEELT